MDYAGCKGDKISEKNLLGEEITDNDFLLLFNGFYEPIQFTIPNERYGQKWRLAVDTNNINSPELVYEPGFKITAQPRSLLILMGNEK